ncbi:MAG: TatD family hydrolase [Cryomorphaceae bacterium]|nr:TatD family hydrolase [Cryomorphaceae bacterium]MBT3503460.1 TatD family hydrolase [Cryomorphaceae bacterium]MBT3688994.1 TatD family hydrolase [Cryomorphaceae bacterium]MBT4222353.1 TatD family hydrolase [Cryomorphaceae bacterium]MBT4293079.1 TatD family hydrolase [Cryomorphaceae bacterium]
MIDTHTHLYLEQFRDDIDDVISRAKAVGVEKFYLPSISSKYNKSMHDLEKKFPDDIFCMIGLHPCSVDDNFDLELDFVKKKIKEHNYKAIGEIGIDLFHEKKYFDQQVIAFEQQIKLAIENDLPIVIHSRDSFDEIFEVLEKFKCEKLRGIFHCFTGNIDQARRIIDLNFHLGIGGVLTFKNGKISEFLNEIPINKIVLETDSPYLAPSPYRGTRNESSYLKIIADKLAEIYNLKIDEISKITQQNSIKVFGD